MVTLWKQILMSFGSFVSQAGLQDHVLSFFVSVDRVSDGHEGEKNDDEAG